MDDNVRARNRPLMGFSLRGLAFVILAMVGGAFVGSVAIDIFHLAPGLGRSTHLPFVILSYAGLLIYIAFHRRFDAVRVLGGSNE